MRTSSRQERPPAPEPLPVPVVDGHTHLEHRRSGDQDALGVAEAIVAAAAVNVTGLLQIGCELESARWTVTAVEEYPQVLGGVALHPTEASRIATGTTGSGGGKALAEAFSEIAELAAHPRVRVVGETGLDHYWVPADDVIGRAAQEESFRWHIDLAKRLGKALQIHDRDAHADVLRILDEEGAPERTVFHCFSGDAEMARLCAGRGWYLSFAGPLTFRNGGALREALAAVPLEQVLAETDAPYLTPHPYRGRPNSSYLLPWTVRGIAEVRGLDLAEVCARLDATARWLYGPW